MGRLMKHSSIYAIGGMLNRVGVFLLLPVYTSYLSLAEYGTLELFYATAAVASGVLSAGLAHATLRFYFEYESEADRNAVVSTNLVLGGLLGIVGAAVIVTARESIAATVFGSPDAAIGLTIISITMALEMSTQICLGYVRAREASKMFLAIVLARLVVQVAANSYAVIGLGAGVTGVLAGNALAVGFGWIWAVGYTLRRCGLRVDLSKADPILRYSLPFLASTVVGVIASNVDRLVIRKLLSFEALGLFALALKFSLLPEQLIGEPFNRAYGAFRFSIMRQDNAASVQARVVRLLLAVAVFTALGVQLFTVDVLRLMSDVEFRGAVAYLPILLLAAVIRIVTYPLQTGILVQRRTSRIFHINLAKSTIYVIGSLVLIQFFGVVGVCLAMVVSASFTMVATDRAAQAHFPVQYEWDRLARVVLIGLGAFLAGVPLVAADTAIVIPLKIAVLAGFCAALIGSAAFDTEERAMASDWLRSRVSLLAGRLPAGQGSH